jgi:sugar phosphate isomerase/epimerase
MQTELGMQMMAEAESIAQNAAWCRELGLRFVELHMSLPACQPEALDKRELRGLMDRNGIYFTLHLPEDMDPAHVSAPVREAWLTLAERAVEAAQEIGAPVLNLHMQLGVHFTLPDRKVRLYERDKGVYLRHIEAFGRRMQAAAGADGPHICLENTGIYDLPYVRQAVERLLAYSCFGVTWDVGHDRESGWRDRSFISRHEGSIRHMHLHDAVLGQAHMPLGEGDIDWESVLRLSQQRGCRVVLEVKTLAGLRRSLEKLRV